MCMLLVPMPIRLKSYVLLLVLPRRSKKISIAPSTPHTHTLFPTAHCNIKTISLAYLCLSYLSLNQHPQYASQPPPFTSYRLKNTGSKLLDCMRAVVAKGMTAYGYQHRVLMTGTPLQNNTGTSCQTYNLQETFSFA